MGRPGEGGYTSRARPFLFPERGIMEKSGFTPQRTKGGEDMKTFMGGVVLGALLVVSRGSPMSDDERTDRQKTVPVRLYPMP